MISLLHLIWLRSYRQQTLSRRVTLHYVIQVVVLARGQIRFHSWILAQSGGASLPDCFSWICSCDVTETKVDFTCSSCIPMTFRGCRGGLFIYFIFFNSAALNGRRKWRQKDEKRAGLLSVHLESCCCLGRRLSCALWIQGLSSKPIGESIINRLKIALHWPPAAAGHLNLLPAAVLADETATSAWRCAATEGSRAPCFIEFPCATGSAPGVSSTKWWWSSGWRTAWQS